MDAAKFAPIENPDTEPYWQSIRDGRLSIQRCVECGTHRHPPSPVCHSCQSFEREWVVSPGRGRVWSFAIVREPLEGWSGELPNVIAIVELEEGVKIVSSIGGPEAEEIKIGTEVEIEFRSSPSGTTLPYFYVKSR